MYIYGIILGVSIVLMILQVWWKCGVTTAIANIGYSLMASFVAAVLVDYGNNNLLNKKQLKEFKQLCFNHNMLANDYFVTVSGLYTVSLLKLKPCYDICRNMAFRMSNNISTNYSLLTRLVDA